MTRQRASEARTHSRSNPGPSFSIREALLEGAGRGRTVTYGELMRRFHLSRGRAFSAALGAIDRAENRSGLPGFAAIVVRRDTGYPGGGFFCDESLPPRLRRPRARGTDPRLSEPERRYVRGQQKKIWAAYSRRARSPLHAHG